MLPMPNSFHTDLETYLFIYLFIYFYYTIQTLLYSLRLSIAATSKFIPIFIKPKGDGGVDT